MVIRFQSGWGRLTMIPGSGRNFTPLPNAVRRGIRLQTICRSMQNGEPSIDYGGSEEPTENDEARNRSAVAAAANICAATVGTETDGSVVCPSGNNLSVGLKPQQDWFHKTKLFQLRIVKTRLARCAAW